MASTSAVADRDLSSQTPCTGYCIDQKLGPSLSAGASIVHNISAAPRWSEFDAPQPGTIVNVATEQDVATTVQFCISNHLTFLAQNGGNGWATTFDIGQNDVVIHLRGLNQISFNKNADQVTLQGGVLVSEIRAATYANNTRVNVGNCDCIGALGAILGGGYGRLVGLHGLGIDSLISVTLVLANGKSMKVTPEDEDLWWALRGAGPNFGIVTSATMKAYPIPRADNTAWTGPLIFTPDKLEVLVQAIDDLDLKPEMSLFLYYATTGPPAYEPAIILDPFYLGSEAAGRAAFASILAIGPAVDMTSVVSYDQWNAGGAPFCIKGGRKPSYSAGFKHMVPATWRNIWDRYVKFLENPGTGNSVVLLEAYSSYKMREVPDETAVFPLRRKVNFIAVALAWYEDPGLDGVATAFGEGVRELWRGTDGLESNLTYVLFLALIHLFGNLHRGGKGLCFAGM
ncbi:hypothetical protein MMC30_007348 [Trapelia coarctata]|nr:hypothetical protein [Trapelia coarctata]